MNFAAAFLQASVQTTRVVMHTVQGGRATELSLARRDARARASRVISLNT